MLAAPDRDSSSDPGDARAPRGWERDGMHEGHPLRHRYLVRALLVIASVLAVLAIFSVWANRQALNADNWSDTSTELLEHPAIRAQVAGFLVDQVYANVDVVGQVRSALPPRLQPLAGPAANGLRQLAERRAQVLLGRPRVQELWKTANRLTAQQFINIAEGNSKAITSSGNAVVLDLRVLLTDLAREVGLSGRLVGQIPPGAGRIKLFSSDQVTTLQNGTDLLKGLAFVLPPLSLVLFGLAVFLAEGRRRRTLMWVGADLVMAGVLVLVLSKLLGHYVVNAVPATDAAVPSAEAAWSIGTGLLREVAPATILG